MTTAISDQATGIAARRVEITANQRGRLPLGDVLSSWRRNPILFGIRFEGTVDVARLQATLDLVVRRHSALRYFFPQLPDSGDAFCAEEPGLSCPLEIISCFEKPDVDDQVLDRVRPPFDLTRPPLIRAVLGVAEHGATLGIAVDHLVFDGASGQVFLDDFGKVWNRLGSRVSHDELSGELSDFSRLAEQENKWLSTNEAAQSLAFWRKQYDGMWPPNFPLPKSTPAAAGSGVVIDHEVPLARFAQSYGERSGRRVSPFTMMCIALFGAAEELNGRRDASLLFPVSGRGHGVEPDLIGYANNQVMLRPDLPSRSEGDALAQVVQEARRQALRHARIPVEILRADFVGQRGLTPSPGACPLFLNMLPKVRMPDLDDVVVEFFIFRDSKYLELPRLSVICESLDEDAVRVTFGHDCSVYSSADVEGLASTWLDVLQRGSRV